MRSKEKFDVASIRISAALIAVLIMIIQFGSDKVIIPKADAHTEESVVTQSSEPSETSVKSTLASTGVIQYVSAATSTTTTQSSSSSSLALSHNNITKKEQKKTVYLTFDDGPSKLTDQVLAILKKENAPSTFFVLGQQAKSFPEVMNRINEAGHVIGNHTYDHKYDKLYYNFSEFWTQIKSTEEVIREITGTRPRLVRAPGGTYDHFDTTYFQLLEQGGYKVFDWDVDSGDSRRRGVPASEIVSNITKGTQKDQVIVLMHDGAGHEQTVKALPEIIAFYKDKGYEFGTLTEDMEPVQFAVSPKMKKDHRSQPSVSWINSHITPNAALFQPGKSLIVDVGGVETKLATGEYDLKDGQYMVPLRATMERLGAAVTWNGIKREVKIQWGKTTVTINSQDHTLTSDNRGLPNMARSIPLETKNGSLWVPLRVILESTGHQIDSVAYNTRNNYIKAS